jgi:uridine kinase
MAQWAPLKKDTLDALASEIMHNYGSGFALVAISAVDTATATTFASDLGDSLEAAGRTVLSYVLDGPDLPARDEGTMFLITGAAATDPSLAGHWNYSVWLEDSAAHGIDRTTRAAASAIVDVTDPEHPRRVFADSC